MFQGLRQNSLIYVLEKTDKGLSLRTGQVTNVSNPQPKYGQFVPNTEMLVDIKVKLDGEESAEFKQLPASGSIANSGNVVVSDSSEAMCAEVDGMLRISQQVIDSVPYHETILASGDAERTRGAARQPASVYEEGQELLLPFDCLFNKIVNKLAFVVNTSDLIFCFLGDTHAQ